MYIAYAFIHINLILVLYQIIKQRQIFKIFKHRLKMCRLLARPILIAKKFHRRGSFNNKGIRENEFQVKAISVYVTHYTSLRPFLWICEENSIDTIKEYCKIYFNMICYIQEVITTEKL